jgi:hypothetical protein
MDRGSLSPVVPFSDAVFDGLVECKIITCKLQGEDTPKLKSNGYASQSVLTLRQINHRISSLTVKRLRPLALRLRSTSRPAAVFILSRKPCLLRRFLLEG